MYYRDRFERDLDEARTIERMATRLYSRGEISRSSYREMMDESKRIIDHADRMETARFLGTLSYYVLKALLND